MSFFEYPKKIKKQIIKKAAKKSTKMMIEFMYYQQIQKIIDSMWNEQETSLYKIGWNSALAELETRIKLLKEEKK